MTLPTTTSRRRKRVVPCRSNRESAVRVSLNEEAGSAACDQSLDLTLLIHAQHNRLVWRIEVQTHDVPDFGHEFRVCAEVEPRPGIPSRTSAREEYPRFITL